MSEDTKKPSVADQVLHAVADKLAQAGYPAGRDACLSDMLPQPEEPELGPDGIVINIQMNEVNVTEHHHNTVTNNGGTVGNMAGERVEGSQATVQVSTALPAEIAKAFEGLEAGIAQANLSEAQKQALNGQLNVLKEEAGKAPDQRNGDLVTGTVKGLELAAAATEAVKAVWDTFGGTITGFFS